MLENKKEKMIEKTVELLHTSEEYWCTGCGACAQGCPTDAITILYDKMGGPQATVAEDACILCGKCLRACPAISFHNENAEEPDCYAVWAEDSIREASSSGGAFAVLAAHILHIGGVVFGVAWTKGYQVAHIAIEDIADLPKLMKSKYVRSNTGNTFQEAEEYLKEGRTVLYSGVPCQIAGLRNFLGKEYDNLYTIDLLCASAPPPFLFQAWLKETYGENLPKKITFKDKHQGWSSYYASVETEEGITYLNQENFPYVRGFLAKTFCPDVCMECKYHSKQRTGDITLGDFWHIQQYKKELNDKKGTGEVLVNNEKGQQLFEQVQEQFTVCEAVPLKYAIRNKLEPSTYRSPYRDRFYDLFDKYGFTKAFQYCFKRKWDVGLVGSWRNQSYGLTLVNLAMYELLQSMNLEVLMLENPENIPKEGENSSYLQRELSYHSYDLADEYPNIRSMTKVNGRADTFIVAADPIQGEHDESCGGVHILDFVLSSKKKIGFSTSIVRQNWKNAPEVRYKVGYDLEKFDYLSVNEKDAVGIWENLLGVKADYTLDPVFLVEDGFYHKLETRAELMLPISYVGGYFTEKPQAGIRKVAEIADHRHQPWKIVLEPGEEDTIQIREELGTDIWEEHMLEQVYEEDWVKFIKHCSLLLTDSYEAACLAIRFGIPFVLKDKNEDSGCRNILTETNLTRRLVQTYEEVQIDDMLAKSEDIVAGYNRLLSEAEKSRDWLVAAIKGEKKSHLTETEYLWDGIRREQYHNVQLEEKCQTLTEQMKEQSDHARNQRIKLHHKIMDLQKARKEQKQDLQSIHKELRVLQKKVTTLESENKKAQKEIVGLKNSYSWKIGRILTYLPRKIKNFLKGK